MAPANDDALHDRQTLETPVVAHETQCKIQT